MWRKQLWDQAKKIATVARCLEWLSLNDDVVKCTMHNNYPEGASDTEHSNRLMQVTKHFLHCAEPLTLTPSCFLLSKLLAAAKGKKKMTLQHESPQTEPWAWGYTNMQQAYQSTVLIFKLQVQNPTAKSIMQCNRCFEWSHHLCKVVLLLHTNSHVRGWRVGGIFSRWWKG